MPAISANLIIDDRGRLALLVLDLDSDCLLLEVASLMSGSRSLVRFDRIRILVLTRELVCRSALLASHSL